VTAPGEAPEPTVGDDPRTSPTAERPTTAVPAYPAATEALSAVLSPDVRPARPGPISASSTFGWRAVLKIKNVPEQLMDVTLWPIMFLLMFTYLFGGAMAGSPAEYLQFVLPGILVLAVTVITMYTGMALNSDIQKGIFDRFKSLPLWQPSALVGALLADAMRYLVGSAVVIGLGLALGFRPGAGFVGVLLAVALVVLFAFSLSWIWAAIGLVARTPESVMYMSWMVLWPLTFISNVFVDPATLPGWLQAFVEVNPVTLVTTAVRGLMHGDVTAVDIGLVVLISAVLIAVFGPLTVRLYRRER
jgi:ABC-2 type transport system permease protein